MKETTIVAQYVNQPKPGKKNGTIKTPDEVLYLAKPDVLSKFQQGGQYKIAYDEYVIGGNQFREIKTVEQLSAAPAGEPRRGYQQDKHLAERIYVCGIVNSWLSNPNFRPPELSPAVLIAITTVARQAWAATFGAEEGASQGQAKRDDMNDEIPW